jgi:folylpolyglutamate synthase/dihydropteroate synthase
MATQRETAVLSVLLNGEQAKNEISGMEKKAEELKRRIKEVGKDSELEKKFAGEPVETGKTVRDLNKHALEVDRVLNNLSTAKPGELRAALSALNSSCSFQTLNAAVRNGSASGRTSGESKKKSGMLPPNRPQPNPGCRACQTGLTGTSGQLHPGQRLLPDYRSFSGN